MKIISDQNLADFFSNSPLYSKVRFADTFDQEAELNFFDYLAARGFKFFCPHDKDYHTYKVNKKYGNQILLGGSYNYNLDLNNLFSITTHVTASCQFCGSKMEFLLNLFTLVPGTENGPFPEVYLRKFGQFPAIQRNPEKEVYNYLQESDRDFYNRALANLSIGYGIGAYAYLRRIVENEIKRIVSDIADLNYPGVEKVKIAWTNYQSNHQMNTLIHSIGQFLPSSLKEVGDNPIKALYQQASGGIHEFSEQECLDKAKHIDTLLQYVIKRISSLKLEFEQVKDALKALNKG